MNSSRRQKALTLLDVLVAGADQRQGLAVVRELGRGGARVLAAGVKPESIGFYSRYAQASLVYPDPRTAPAAFRQAIKEAADSRGISVVFPAVESAVCALNDHRAIFSPGPKLALPPAEAVAACLNKSATAEIAAAAGIPTPQGIQAENTVQALQYAADAGYPVILKLPSGGADFKVLYASNAEELRLHLERAAQFGRAPLIQKYFRGKAVGVGFLYLRGRLAGLYQYEQTRESPYIGGVTCVHSSMPVDKRLADFTASFLEAVGYEGLGEADYRVNPHTKEVVLLEVNPRVWAPIAASSHLGLNFAAAYYEFLQTGMVPGITASYTYGRRCRYLRGDIAALTSHLRRPASGAVEPVPARWSALLDFLKDFRPSVDSDVFDVRDPLPALADVITIVAEYAVMAVHFFRKYLGKTGQAAKSSLPAN